MAWLQQFRRAIEALRHKRKSSPGVTCLLGLCGLEYLYISVLGWRTLKKLVGFIEDFQ
jgi:hypothetical protein